MLDASSLLVVLAATFYYWLTLGYDICLVPIQPDKKHHISWKLFYLTLDAVTYVLLAAFPLMLICHAECGSLLMSWHLATYWILVVLGAG